MFALKIPTAQNQTNYKKGGERVVHRLGSQTPASTDRITPRSYIAHTRTQKKCPSRILYPLLLNSPCGNCAEELIPGSVYNKRSVRNTGSKKWPAKSVGGHLRHSPRGRSSLRKRTFVPSSCVTDPWGIVCPHARGLIDLRQGTHGKRALSRVRETDAQTCDSLFQPSAVAACCFVEAYNVSSPRTRSC